MSKIILYKLNCERTRLNKDDYLEEIETVEGKFNNAINIQTPTLTIKSDNILNCNYCYIEDLKRYYFINYHIGLNNNVYTISLIEDELYTFKEDVLKLDAFILRNQYKYNNDLVDSLRSFKSNYNINKQVFNVSELSQEISTSTEPNIVISVLNNINQDNEIPEFKSNFSKFFNQQNQFKIPNNLQTNYIMTLDGFNLFLRALYAESNYTDLMGSIIRLTVTPFNLLSNISRGSYLLEDPTQAPSEVNGPQKLKITLATTYLLGPMFNPGDPYAYLCSSTWFWAIKKVINIKRYYNDFRDFNGFSVYKMWLPLYGFIDIDDSFINKDLTLILAFDINTMEGMRLINDENTILKKVDVKIGIDIPLDGDNYYQSVMNGINTTINASLGVIGGTLAGGVTGGGVGAVVGAVGGITKGTMSMIEATNQKPTSTCTGSFGTGVLVNNMSKDIEVYQITKNILDIDETKYLYQNGKPLQEYAYLKDLYGFTQCNILNLNNINASNSELLSLQNILNNGIYLADPTPTPTPVVTEYNFYFVNMEDGEYTINVYDKDYTEIKDFTATAEESILTLKIPVTDTDIFEPEIGELLTPRPKDGIRFLINDNDSTMAYIIYNRDLDTWTRKVWPSILYLNKLNKSICGYFTNTGGDFNKAIIMIDNESIKTISLSHNGRCDNIGYGTNTFYNWFITKQPIYFKLGVKSDVTIKLTNREATEEEALLNEYVKEYGVYEWEGTESIPNGYGFLVDLNL